MKRGAGAPPGRSPVRPGRTRGERGAGKTGPVRIADVVGEVLQEAGVSEQVERVGVLEEWPRRVGPAIAEVTRARAVDWRRLVVEVRSSAWMMELDLMKREILERVNEGRSGALIDRVVFVLAEKG